MATKFANLVKVMQRRDTDVNLEQALAMAHAESNKAGWQLDPTEEWYAWNRVIRALWDVQRLHSEREAKGDTDGK